MDARVKFQVKGRGGNLKWSNNREEKKRTTQETGERNVSRAGGGGEAWVIRTGKVRSKDWLGEARIEWRKSGGEGGGET